MSVIMGAIDLKKRFKIPGGKPIEVLKGVNFSVRSGEKVAIVGRSGSGKSTLLNILGGLEKQTSGTVTRPRDIGFVFQQYHLMPELTVLENALLPTMKRSFIRSSSALSAAACKARATELLERVGLKDRLEHLPGELSGGEQQRVALARALVSSPKIVLADEPTGNLDSKTSVQIMGLFQELYEQGKTVIVVTHEPDIDAYAKSHIVVKDGRILKYEV